MSRDISELSDIQSESGVIGTLIFHPDFILHSDYLQPNHFFNTENGCIYWAIKELCNDNITRIDAFNLTSKMQSSRGVQKVMEKYNMPSVQELVELFKEAARSTLEEYRMLADTVVCLAFKREMHKSLDKIQLDLFNPEINMPKLNNIVYDEMDKVTQNFMTQEEIKTLGSQIDSIWEEIKSRRTKSGIYGLPSKYQSFAEYFTYEPGELVVIQAKYKQGKSVFLMNEVVDKIRNGTGVLVVDSEMPTRSYTERLISHLSGIEVRRVKNGAYSTDEGKKISTCIDWLREQPFVHIYNPSMSMEHMYALCKILKRKINLGFVAYDYLKSNEITNGENYNVLGAKCDYLKNNIAGELELPVLAACQLNRAGEVADSIKINRYLSVGIKWERKTAEMIAKDGQDCGNAYAKVYVNRLGAQMQEDDKDEYIDFFFRGDVMTIGEAKQHKRANVFV